MELNPVTVPEWLAALRSGDYRKTVGYLHDLGEGYCCLGVLARCGGATDEDLTNQSTLLQAGLVPTGEVAEFLAAPQEGGTHEQDSVERNDLFYGGDVTFDRMADWLEARYAEWKQGRP